MHGVAVFDDSAHYIVNPIESTNCLMLAQFQLEWSSFRIHSRQPVSQVVLVHKERVDDVGHKKDLESGKNLIFKICL